MKSRILIIHKQSGLKGEKIKAIVAKVRIKTVQILKARILYFPFSKVVLLLDNDHGIKEP